MVLAFVVFFIPQDFLQTGTGDGWRRRRAKSIAEVEGRQLTAGDFQQRYAVQVQQYRTQFGGTMNDQLLRQLGVDQQVLTQMVDEQVALIEAERQGIKVSDEELAQQIFAIPGLQENGRFIGERGTSSCCSAEAADDESQFEERCGAA